MNLPMNKATMSSREIANISGKNHYDVLKAIRAMEPVWEKTTGGKFSVSEYKDSSGRRNPYYELTKRECLYVATKFNDEARAKLVLRWEQLETNNMAQLNQIATAMSEVAKTLTTMVTTLSNFGERLAYVEDQFSHSGKHASKTTIKIPTEVIDARNREYDFAKVNNSNVRRIIINERVYYSINDFCIALGIKTSAYQIAQKLNRNAPHTVAKIHIFGNTHPAWFCTKLGIELIQSGSRKLNGHKVTHELI